MQSRCVLPLALLVLTSSTIAACTTAVDEQPEPSQQAITSNVARILDFKFSAEVVAGSGTGARKAIVSQLMYVQGILTTSRDGNGKVGQVVLSNVRESVEGDRQRIKYSASLPVAFPKDRDTPGSYDLVLPLDVTALGAFNAKYDGRCGKNAHGRDDFWTDWNPKAGGCSIDDGDVVRTTASVSPYANETRNKYPEYDQIWGDGRLDVVAIFAIVTSNSHDDWGYREFDSFLWSSKGLLSGTNVRDNPRSDSILQDKTLTGSVTVGGREKPVHVDILLVEHLQHARSDFDARYDPISEKADLLLYSGHAGLGRNVNALARKGRVARDKYQLVLLNGCQTFAHIDTTLNDRRIQANGRDRDPQGTRYMDVVANALPGYANNLASVSAAFFGAAVKADRPRAYNELLDSMPSNHIVVVFGEEDNRFTP